MNKTFLIGNLTRDPELSETPSGVSVCKMSIAVNRNFTNANGERETDFFNIVAWRGLADNCAKYLSKGKKIAVVGSFQNRSYTDSNGEKKYVTEVMADEIEFLSPVSEDEQQSKPTGQGGRKPNLQPLGDDFDCPF